MGGRNVSTRGETGEWEGGGIERGYYAEMMALWEGLGR